MKEINFHKASFNKKAWLLIALALIVVACGVGLALYRLSLPTDGWYMLYAADNSPNMIFDHNVIGAPSDLIKGDILIAVENIPVEQLSPDNFPAGWSAGKLSQYTVRRNDQLLTFGVPIVNWPARVVWAAVSAPQILVVTLGYLIFLAVAWFAFIKRTDSQAAQALLVLASIVFILATEALNPSGIVDPSGVTEKSNTLVYDGLTVLILGMFTIGFPPSLLRFTLVFPRPKASIVRHPWLGMAPYLFGLIILVIWSGADIFFHQDISWIGYANTVGMIFASVVSLVHSAFTQRDAVSRAQLRWGVGGMLLGVSFFLASYLAVFGLVTGPAADFFNIANSLSFPVIGLALAVAILRYRLFDIDVIIRRTLVYAALTGALALTYFGLVVLLGQFLRTAAGQSSPLVVVISTLAIAALFTPLRRWLQNSVDRAFYRRKYDSTRALEIFNTFARSEVELDNLAGRLVTVVDEAVKPEAISLWLKPTIVKR